MFAARYSDTCCVVNVLSKYVFMSSVICCSVLPAAISALANSSTAWFCASVVSVMVVAFAGRVAAAVVTAVTAAGLVMLAVAALVIVALLAPATWFLTIIAAVVTMAAETSGLFNTLSTALVASADCVCISVLVTFPVMAFLIGVPLATCKVVFAIPLLTAWVVAASVNISAPVRYSFTAAARGGAMIAMAAAISGAGIPPLALGVAYKNLPLVS